MTKLEFNIIESSFYNARASSIDLEDTAEDLFKIITDCDESFKANILICLKAQRTVGINLFLGRLGVKY